MTFCLNSKIIKPEGNKAIKNAIILLHGYGGSGDDIAALSINWKRFLPNTIFICPDGHEKCKINPSGYQWFDLTTENEKTILEGAIKAENILHKFIEEIKFEYKLKTNQICLSGFSQGCMISINIGLTSNEALNCVVGFSGKVLNKKDLAKRKTKQTNFLLIHGENDDVVSATNLLDAKDFFLRNKVPIETVMIKNLGHFISAEASSKALNFIRKNLSY